MDLNFERIRNNKLEILRDISVKTFIETFASQNKEENILLEQSQCTQETKRNFDLLVQGLLGQSRS